MTDAPPTDEELSEITDRAFFHRGMRADENRALFEAGEARGIARAVEELYVNEHSCPTGEPCECWDEALRLVRALSPEPPAAPKEGPVALEPRDDPAYLGVWRCTCCAAEVSGFSADSAWRNIIGPYANGTKYGAVSWQHNCPKNHPMAGWFDAIRVTAGSHGSIPKVGAREEETCGECYQTGWHKLQCSRRPGARVVAVAELKPEPKCPTCLELGVVYPFPESVLPGRFRDAKPCPDCTGKKEEVMNDDKPHDLAGAREQLRELGRVADQALGPNSFVHPYITRVLVALQSEAPRTGEPGKGATTTTGPAVGAHESPLQAAEAGRPVERLTREELEKGRDMLRYRLDYPGNRRELEDWMFMNRDKLLSAAERDLDRTERAAREEPAIVRKCREVVAGSNGHAWLTLDHAKELLAKIGEVEAMRAHELALAARIETLCVKAWEHEAATLRAKVGDYEAELVAAKRVIACARAWNNTTSTNDADAATTLLEDALAEYDGAREK